MFGFLKEKLKNAVARFTREVEPKEDVVVSEAIGSEAIKGGEPVFDDTAAGATGSNERVSKATEEITGYSAEEDTLLKTKSMESKAEQYADKQACGKPGFLKKRQPNNAEMKPEGKNAVAEETLHILNQKVTNSASEDSSEILNSRECSKDEKKQPGQSRAYGKNNKASEQSALQKGFLTKIKDRLKREKTHPLFRQEKKDGKQSSERKTEDLDTTIADAQDTVGIKGGIQKDVKPIKVKRVSLQPEAKHGKTEYLAENIEKEQKQSIKSQIQPTEKNDTYKTETSYEEGSEIQKGRAIDGQIAADKEPEVKRGFFGKITDSITRTSISEEKFEEIFYELEIGLLENNVALEVVDKIKADLKEELVNKKVRIGKASEEISKALHNSIEGLFNVKPIKILEEARKKKPYVITFVGVNGSGKTTTIAKMAALFKNNGLGVVIAAGDTFRAAAIQQLEEHANKLGVKLIKHEYGSDPAAVAFDAVKYAEARGIDVVLIDTAGRLHSNSNLMDEMKKIIRVAKPDMKLFIGESITGNDCVEQARQFNDAVGIDGIILAKADVDEKGGAMISVSYITKKPILYLGNGQDYGNLVEFNPKLVTESIGL